MDQPQGLGLVPGRAEDAWADAGELGPHNPVAVAVAFMHAVTQGSRPLVRDLRLAIVTPESVRAWGNFREARRALEGRGMTTRADRAVGAPDVAYAKYPADPKRIMKADTDVLMAALICTLVYRPELGGWRVHGLGDYFPPDLVPRSKP